MKKALLILVPLTLMLAGCVGWFKGGEPDAVLTLNVYLQIVPEQALQSTDPNAVQVQPDLPTPVLLTSFEYAVKKEVDKDANVSWTLTDFDKVKGDLATFDALDDIGSNYTNVLADYTPPAFSVEMPSKDNIPSKALLSDKKEFKPKPLSVTIKLAQGYETPGRLVFTQHTGGRLHFVYSINGYRSEIVLSDADFLRLLKNESPKGGFETQILDTDFDKCSNEHFSHISDGLWVGTFMYQDKDSVTFEKAINLMQIVTRYAEIKPVIYKATSGTSACITLTNGQSTFIPTPTATVIPTSTSVPATSTASVTPNP